jgi:hypothetical protein
MAKQLHMFVSVADGNVWHVSEINTTKVLFTGTKAQCEAFIARGGK